MTRHNPMLLSAADLNHCLTDTGVHVDFSLEWSLSPLWLSVPFLHVIVLWDLPEMSSPQRSLPWPLSLLWPYLFLSLSRGSPWGVLTTGYRASAYVQTHIMCLPSPGQVAQHTAGTHEISGNQLNHASCFSHGNIWICPGTTSAPSPGRMKRGNSNEALLWT